MKQINEQISRMRTMMGLNENVNEFFSMPGEREGLPAPVDEELEEDEQSSLDWLKQREYLKNNPGKPNPFMSAQDIADKNKRDRERRARLKAAGKSPAEIRSSKNKQSNENVTTEDDTTNKYAKLEAAIAKDGARNVAIRLVDALLMKYTGMFTASDLADTATYANGLDSIQEALDGGDYQAAYSIAKETASDMLEEEGYSDFLGENESPQDVEESTFSFDDRENDQALNKKFINDYVNAIEKRFRVKKMGVTKDEVMERLDDMGEQITPMDLDYLLFTLAKKGLLFTDTTYTNKVNPQEFQPHQEPTSGEDYTDTEKLAFSALNRNMNEKVTLTKKSMVNALSEAKKKGKTNPWAVCTASVGRDDKDKYERCVTDVKKKENIKK